MVSIFLMLRFFGGVVDFFMIFLFVIVVMSVGLVGNYDLVDQGFVVVMVENGIWCGDV